MIEIKVGQIWQVVTDDFWSSKKGDHITQGRKSILNLKKNEFIEIRYPFEWHFRTEDNCYVHAEPQDILKHCRLYGVIKEDISFGNRHSLKEIMKQKLYTAIWESEG